MCRSRSTAVPICLATLLVVSGCLSAPPADTANRGIEVRNGGLPVDPDLAFDRVTGLLDRRVEPPLSVQIVDPETAELPDITNQSPSISDIRPFWQVMGVTRKPGSTLNFSTFENGVTSAFGGVRIFTGDNESDVVHYVLVHEFVHFVQFRGGDAERLAANVGPSTTDGRFVYRAILEGVAVYTTDEYIRRYMDTDERNTALYREIDSRIPRGGVSQFGNSQYVFGARYVADQLSSPSEASRLYDRPPRTAEQVIHGVSPGEEPPRNLTVTVEGNGWRRVGSDRLGEGFVRVALRNGLDGTTADRAAAGWGNDTLITLGVPGEFGTRSYAWVARWDDREEATEFVEAFRSALDSRGTRTDEGYRVAGWSVSLRSPGGATTVLFVGDGTLAGNASAAVRDDAVALELPSPSDREAGNASTPR